MPLSATQSRDPREVVVVEPEAAADRLAVGEVEHLARRSGGGRRARAAGRRRRAPGWSGAASGRRAGRAGRSGAAPRAAGRTRRRRPPRRRRTSPGSAARTSRCPGTSRSRRAARACRVLREQVQDRVAQDLDLAGAAVAGVDLDAAVAGVEPRAGVGDAGQRQAERRAVGADVGLDAREQRVARRARPGGGGRRARASRARAAARASPGPRRRAAGCRRARRSCRRRGGRPAARRCRSCSHSAGEGCSRKRWTSRPAASARRTSRWPAGSRVRPKSERRVGQVDERRARRAAARTRARGARPGSGSASRVAQAPPQLAPATSASSPRAHARTSSGPVQRVAVEQLGEVADGGEAARAPVGVVLAPRWSASARSHGSSRRSSTTSSSGHTARSGSHGSASGIDPRGGRDRVADEPARERELDVRAHPVGAARAWRRGARTCRCVSQRSIPRVGHGDDLGRERVGERVGEQLAERLDEPVGAFGSVDVEHRSQGEVARRQVTLTSDPVEPGVRSCPHPPPCHTRMPGQRRSGSIPCHDGGRDLNHAHARPRALAVRDHDDLPLPARADHDRPVGARGA